MDMPTPTEGDEAYFDTLGKGRSKSLDNRTFKLPIKSIGLRSCAVLAKRRRSPPRSRRCAPPRSARS